MSYDINDYLRNLQDNTRINKLIADENTDVGITLDLYSGEYKGAIISFNKDDNRVEIDTANHKITVTGDKKTSSTLDSLTALGIDDAVLSVLNINKFDEDYFIDLKESIEEDILSMYEKESKNIEKAIKAYLKEVVRSDYDRDTVVNTIRRFDIIEKSDHLNLEKSFKGTSVKYNAGKNKITVKNITNYKNKFSPEDLVDDFDKDAYMTVVNEFFRKKKYNENRLEIGDGMEDSSSIYTQSNILLDKGRLDLTED